MSTRFAFTAQFWGDGAVVCRAVEDQPGPVVEPQFGEFPTWTRALHFANKLNDGFDLDPRDVRQIVTSSLLATARVLQQAVNSRLLLARTAAETRSIHMRFVLSELTLALTLCRSASLLSRHPSYRVSLLLQRTLHRANNFLRSSADPKPELHEIASRVEALQASLRALAPASARVPTAPNRE